MPPVNAMDRHAVERVRLAVGERIECLAFRRRRDGQMVVLDQKQHGQLRPDRFGTGLQKLAFLRASVTDRMEHQWPRMMILDHGGHPDRLQSRITDRSWCAENLQLAIRKRMGTHLATARRRGLLAEQPVKKRARRHPARKHQRLVAVMTQQPVLGMQQRRQDRRALVPSTRNMEKRLTTVVQLEFQLVDPARRHHRPVHRQ